MKRRLKVWYYRTFFNKDIIKVLKFLMLYSSIGVPYNIIIDVMRIDFNWTAYRTERALYMCYYCGFIEAYNGGNEQNVNHETTLP